MTWLAIGLAALAGLVSFWALARTHALTVIMEELFRRLTTLEREWHGP